MSRLNLPRLAASELSAPFLHQRRRVLAVNSPTGCSAKRARHGRRLRARRGAPFTATRVTLLYFSRGHADFVTSRMRSQEPVAEPAAYTTVRLQPVRI